MIVTLIGYRGTGKTSVARALAARLDFDAVDADSEIEIRAGCTIRALFANEGEASFRKRERDVMDELLRRDRLVIAAGGGAVLDPASRLQMRSAGPVVWLQASIDEIERRIAEDPHTRDRRPNLTAAGGRREIEELLVRREPLYRECATVIVATDGRSADELADSILSEITRRPEGGLGAVTRLDFPLVFLVPYLFALGAVVGSFLNVCIYRLPAKERFLDQLRGLWSPPSHCPRCGRHLLAKDNVPVLGWLLLRGRCRFCRGRISPRYPLMEAANGLLFLLVFFCEVPVGMYGGIQQSCVYSDLGPMVDPHSWLFSPLVIVLGRWLYHMVLIESLVVASFIDFDLRIIPDGATLPAMAVGVLGGCLLGSVYLVPVWFQDVSTMNALSSVLGGPLSALLRGPHIPKWIAVHPHLHGLATSLAGLVVGGGSVWLVRVMGHWVLKREAMGFGDVILMATIGSFLGWQPTLVVFFVAPMCALAVVLAGWLIRRDREIPYGPYLSLATLIVLLDWKQFWPRAERVFSMGLFVPAMAVFMCAMLFLSLQLTQWAKRLLGIPDYVSPDEDAVWHSADQLFHFSGDRIDRNGEGWNRPVWPGLRAGRGSLFADRWRHGGK